MSGVHERQMTVVGRASAWIAHHPIRFQVLGLAGVVLVVAAMTVGQPGWRVALQATGALYCLWFGAMFGLILARCRGRRRIGL